MILASFNWFVPFYLLGIFGIVCFFLKRQDAKQGKVNWSPLEAVGVTIAIYFLGQIIGSLLAYVYPLLRGWSQTQAVDWLQDNVYGQFLTILFVEAVSVWLLYVFLKRRSANFSTIGLKRHPKLSDLGYVVLGFLGYFFIYILIVSIVKQFAPGLNEGQQQQLGFNNPSGVQLPFVFISLVILPPIAEELLVRGFLYSGLKKGLPLIWAVLLTSGLFGIAHLQAGSGEPLLWIAALDTFSLSLVLIYLREKTGSLWASIGLHMLKNLIAFLGLFVFHVV
jgi:membrane protease YdiL (CAAX protease family)